MLFAKCSDNKVFTFGANCALIRNHYIKAAISDFRFSIASLKHEIAGRVLKSNGVKLTSYNWVHQPFECDLMVPPIGEKLSSG